jgi:hypothetical protein
LAARLGARDSRAVGISRWWPARRIASDTAHSPSQAVKEIRSGGFRGAAGEDLNRGGPTGDEIRTGVVKFKSASAAESGPPTRYLFEFTVEPYLYFASTDLIQLRR